MKTTIKQLRLNPAIMVWVILCCLAALGVILVKQAPSVWYLQSLKIDQDSILGYAELGQYPAYASADKQHIHVKKTEDDWLLTNVSPQKKVWVSPKSSDSHYLKRWALQTGDVIQINETQIHVIKTDQQGLQLMTAANTEAGERKVSWQAESIVPALSSDEANYSGCPASSGKGWIKRLLRLNDSLFSLGGRCNALIVGNSPNSH